MRHGLAFDEAEKLTRSLGSRVAGGEDDVLEVVLSLLSDIGRRGLGQGRRGKSRLDVGRVKVVGREEERGGSVGGSEALRLRLDDLPRLDVGRRDELGLVGRDEAKVVACHVGVVDGRREAVVLHPGPGVGRATLA